MSWPLEREYRFIGAALQDRRAVDAGVSSDLQPEHFEAPSLGRVWQACLDVAQEGGVVDSVSVAERLHAEGDLERIGGPVGIRGILDSAPTSATAAHDAGKIRERGVLRLGARDASDLLATTLEGRAEPDQVREWAEGFVRNLAPRAGRTETDPSRLLDDLADGTPPDFVTTGFEYLDQRIRGMFRGSLVIVGAKPSVGKSAWMLDAARHVAHSGRMVRWISLEMRATEMAARLCAQEGGGDALALLAGEIPNGPRYAEARGRISDMAMTIHYEPGASLAGISRLLDFADGRPDMVVLDFIQELPPPRGAKRHEFIGDAARELKIMAGRLNCVMMVGSQLRRDQNGKHEPDMEDLAESAGLERAADLMIMLHRPREDSEDRVVVIRKNRNGPRGRWEVGFRPEATSFRF